MKSMSAVLPGRLLMLAAGAVLVIGIGVASADEGGGSFVSVFDGPQGLCWVDLARAGGWDPDPDANDAREEAEAGRRASAKFGDFRGVRPGHVVKAQEMPACGGKWEIDR